MLAKLEARPISADSHVTEPPIIYTEYVEPKYRDRAPKLVPHSEKGEVYAVDGMPNVPLGMAAAAGKDPKTITFFDAKFENLYRGGWDAKARLADMDRDGVAAEVVYPTVGMVLCNHPDANFKAALFRGYNRWLRDYISEGQGRVCGIGQSAVSSVTEAIEDVITIKESGFKGAMFPGFPGTDFDYDDKAFDPLWSTLVELGLPVSFHSFTSAPKKDGERLYDGFRGGQINSFLSVMRENQNILGMMIFSGVFERFPGLKVVCVEADAGWAPHFMYRMDHVFNRHRFWAKATVLEKRLPSEYFADNIYLTFQDDWIAFQVVDLLNWKRLMWASDYPHSDSTWPNSTELLKKHAERLSIEQRAAILRGNVTDLYKLPLSLS
jgi:predicted TIM-barrel fold metal-dependent hydrolase